MSRHSLSGVIILSLLLLLSFSANPPQGRTGGPGEATCASIGCHSGVNIAFDGRVELRGLPDQPESNVSYSLIVDLIIDSGTPARGGFQMIALSSNEEDIGGFSNPGEQSTISSSGGRTYFEHDPAKNFEDSDTISYTVDFKIDNQFEEDSVIFYAAANFANGSGSSGDRIITFSDTLTLKNSSDTLLNLQTFVTPPTCPNGDDGSVKITPSGGLAPYTFSVQERTMVSDSCALFDQLSSGVYNVTVVDANEQEVVQSIIIPTVDVDDTPPVISCISDTLIIESCTPFSYPLPTAVDNCGSTEVELISGKGPNQSFESGIHLEIYRATDEMNNSTLCTIFIHNQVILDIDVTVNDIKCIGDSLGSVEFNIEGSNPPFSVRHMDDISLDSLPIGDHILVLEDISGCLTEETFTIENADSLLLEIVDIKQPISSTSGDGAIDINVIGGQKPYTYIWTTEDEVFSNAEDLTLLFPGDYSVVVMDDNNCMVKSDTIQLDAITNLTEVSISNSLVLSPNPSNNYITIESTIKSEIKELELFDVHGQRLQIINDQFGMIPVHNFPEGIIYVVITLKNNKKGLSRFIKTQ